MKSTLSSVLPKSKRSSLSQLINGFSPNTKIHVASEINVPESHSSRMDMLVYNDLKKRRDRLSNCASKIVLEVLSYSYQIQGNSPSTIKEIQAG